MLAHPAFITRAMLGFALRMAAAALTALLAASLLGLPNPYWAAMTVWIVAQPTRGMLWERSLYRLLGTTIGAAAGFAILHLVTGPAAVVLALALWAGLCALVGNLLRHLRAYGALLAGYSAAIVVLPDFVSFCRRRISALPASPAR